MLTEGWSIHELGTARMGTDPKTSVLNQFQQSHDVKNLFVVDGSSHVNASCQNPTWTIMALAWRSCDYLGDRVQEGEPVMSDHDNELTGAMRSSLPPPQPRRCRSASASRGTGARRRFPDRRANSRCSTS